MEKDMAKKMIEEDHKKWLCELAGIKYELWKTYEGLEHLRKYIWKGILQDAMWAINREKKYLIEMYKDGFTVYDYEPGYNNFNADYKNHNNSEQQALQAALEYIYKEINK